MMPVTDGPRQDWPWRAAKIMDDALSANAAAPEGARVVLETTDGRSFSGVLEEPTGMPGNPLSDEQLGAKFLACCDFAEAERAWAEQLLETLWAIENQPELTGLFART